MTLIPTASFGEALLSAFTNARHPLALAIFGSLTLTAACGDENPMGLDVPLVEIVTPTAGTMLAEGAVLQLTGSATDPQDGTLADEQLVWSSSIDGLLGSGASVEVASPSVGLHTITLTATDSDSNESTSAISVSVAAFPFLDGTPSSAEIGVIVNSTANALRLFQVGDPTDFREIALGASSAITATGVSVLGDRAAVPLGNGASVAIIDLRDQQIDGFYLFDSGNATGSAFVDANTVIAANQSTDVAGKFTIGQADNAISTTVAVTPFPNDVVTVSDSLVLIVSANLDDSFAPIGEAVVTAIDPRTMVVLDTVHTGGTNAQFGALGPDGLFYVPNTGDFVSASSLAIIDPVTMTRVDLIEGFAAGSGAVHVDSSGLVYVSAFFAGTLIWDATAETFVRDSDDPLCAPLAGGGCRGAFSATTGEDGSVYQTFFGSASQDLEPWVFRYDSDLTLVDSIPSGLGPVEVEVHTFRN